MEDRRKHPRIEVDEPAYICGDGSSTRCKVLNLSSDGAAIEVPNSVYVPARFQLMTEKDRMVRECRIVWMQQNRIGVAFD